MMCGRRGSQTRERETAAVAAESGASRRSVNPTPSLPRGREGLQHRNRPVCLGLNKGLTGGTAAMLA
jgi:hypothetical protein